MNLGLNSVPILGTPCQGSQLALNLIQDQHGFQNQGHLAQPYPGLTLIYLLN